MAAVASTGFQVAPPSRDHNTMPFLVLGDKYARAVKAHTQAQPVMFPLASVDQIEALLDLVDGVMLTGSPSNVHPSHFGAAVVDTALPLDEARDTLTLALVKACVALGWAGASVPRTSP